MRATNWVFVEVLAMWQPDSTSVLSSESVKEHTDQPTDPGAPEPDRYDQLLVARLVDDGCPHVHDDE